MTIEHSADIGELSGALLKAQGAMNGAAKDSKNPHFKNTYASLESVIDAAKPALQAAGVAFTQAPGQIIDNAVEVTTMLMHSSGQWLRSTLHVPLMKRDAQSVGSAITYGCRYSLMATLGLPPVDDDGQAASAPAPKPEPQKQQPPETPFDEPPAVAGPDPDILTEVLARQIRIAKATADIDSVVKSPEFKRSFGMLPPQYQSVVKDVTMQRRAALNPMGAG